MMDWNGKVWGLGFPALSVSTMQYAGNSLWEQYSAHSWTISIRQHDNQMSDAQKTQRLGSHVPASL